MGTRLAPGGDSDTRLRKRVAAKFAEGDVRGAVRELASSDGLAPPTATTVVALRAKHPPAPLDLNLPDPPCDSMRMVIATDEDVSKAISSFRPGSAGGPDGLRPGHLKSLVGHASAEAGPRLLSALTDLVNLILRGEVPAFVLSTFYGATLCALEKKGGGVRPIAVGNTFRRLATKIGARRLSSALGRELQPVQLGVSCKGGCEAAAHAARRYLRDCDHKRVLLKVDMRNAFNCLRRDSFLSVARSRAAGLYGLLWQAYSEPSSLFFGKDVLKSETGIQQGDPFGPALFALAVDEAARGVDTEFNVWYLDDATLGGAPEKVFEAARTLLVRLSTMGLEVNSGKCELTILNDVDPGGTESMFRGLLPGVRVVQDVECSLLGAPVSPAGIPGVLLEKKRDLDLLISKLELVDNHQAFVLLRNAFAIPKLQYILRASPAFLCVEQLRLFDESLRDALARVTNVEMEDASWVQASLPVGLGGLGCRRARDVALPAFVSSMHSVELLVETILSNINMVDTVELSEAEELWRRRCGGLDFPTDRFRQKDWDIPLATVSRDELLNGADQVVRARLLAAMCKESGLWLNAVPVPSLGTQLDPEVLRIAIALRIGAKVCEPHSCRCGRMMDDRGLHGLSCRYSAGRHPRHSAMNDVVKRALQRAGLPSVLEPPGLDRGDGSRPDGITVFPFSRGRSLVWDCTCVDTFAESHLVSSAVEAGVAAGEAEVRKRRKYAGLVGAYLFEPIAVETTGVYGVSTSLILRAIGRRLVEATGEPRESNWFLQNLAVRPSVLLSRP